MQYLLLQLLKSRDFMYASHLRWKWYRTTLYEEENPVKWFCYCSFCLRENVTKAFSPNKHSTSQTLQRYFVLSFLFCDLPLKEQYSNQRLAWQTWSTVSGHHPDLVLFLKCPSEAAVLTFHLSQCQQTLSYLVTENIPSTKSKILHYMIIVLTSLDELKRTD